MEISGNLVSMGDKGTWFVLKILGCLINYHRDKSYMHGGRLALKCAVFKYYVWLNTEKKEERNQ